MSSPLDRTRHSMATPAVAADDQATAPSGVTGRLPYPEILRQFASLLGEQLGREHLADARKADADADGTNR
jgi:hypothetical protein